MIEKNRRSYLMGLFLVLIFMTQNLYSASDFLVDSEWLSEHLDDEKTIVLEVRYHPHRYFTVGHIQGAVQVKRFKDLGNNQASPLMKFPDRAALQKTLRSFGVNNDSQIVIYDDSRTALASRLYFLLELYGFNMQQVKILNGGTIEWSAFEELVKQKPKIQAGRVTLMEANPDLFVTWTAIYDQVAERDPNRIILDARPKTHYTGEEIVHAARGGHIPGAINIVSLDGTDGQSQSWKSLSEIQTMYAGLDKMQTIYIYCHDGFRMSLAYLQLKALGYKKVKLYDGGWGHWGNALTLPVVQGEKPFDEAFSL